MTVEQVTDRMTERRERLQTDIQEAIDLLVDESRLQQVPPHLGNEVVPPMRYTITDRGVTFLEPTNAAPQGRPRSAPFDGHLPDEGRWLQTSATSSAEPDSLGDPDTAIASTGCTRVASDRT